MYIILNYFLLTKKSHLLRTKVIHITLLLIKMFFLFQFSLIFHTEFLNNDTEYDRLNIFANGLTEMWISRKTNTAGKYDLLRKYREYETRVFKMMTAWIFNKNIYFFSNVDDLLVRGNKVLTNYIAPIQFSVLAFIINKIPFLESSVWRFNEHIWIWLENLRICCFWSY